jgi:hypothetical protein
MADLPPTKAMADAAARGIRLHYEGKNPIGPEGDERFMQMQMPTVNRIVEGDQTDGA